MANIFTRRSVVGLASGVLAAACFLILAILTIILASSQLAHSVYRAPVVASTVFELLALLALVGSIAIYAQGSEHFTSRTGSRKWSLIAAIVLPSVVAIVLTLVSLILLSVNQSQIRIANKANFDVLVDVSYAFLAIAAVSETAFFSISFAKHITSAPATTESEDVDQSFSTVSEAKASSSLELKPLPPPPFRLSQMSSIKSSVGAAPVSQRSSVRNSVQQLLQPMSSRSRLIRQTSFQSETSSFGERPISLNNRQEDGFDTWEVDPELGMAEIEKPNPARLETIPGSRSVSPAKALDGPYIQEPDDHSSISSTATPDLVPDSPLPSPVIHSPNPEDHLWSRGRQGSINDQSHIHPLFRTDSPIPPPAASPGTIVTASPWGGQVVASRDRAYSLTRPGSRTNSRPASPALASPTWSQLDTRASLRSTRFPLRSVRSEDYLPRGAPQEDSLPVPKAPILRRQQSHL